MLEAVPYSCVNMAETREIWSCDQSLNTSYEDQHHRTYLWGYNKTNHGCTSTIAYDKYPFYIIDEQTTLPSGCVKALDELLDLPHLDVLLCLFLTHGGGRIVLFLGTMYSKESDLSKRRSGERGEKKARPINVVKLFLLKFSQPGSPFPHFVAPIQFLLISIRTAALIHVTIFSIQYLKL